MISTIVQPAYPLRKRGRLNDRGKEIRKQKSVSRNLEAAPKRNSPRKELLPTSGPDSHSGLHKKGKKKSPHRMKESVKSRPISYKAKTTHD